jgi:hypothetical protein
MSGARDPASDTRLPVSSDDATSEAFVLAPGAASRTLTFARLVLHLGEGVERFDEHFARTVARSLEARSAHVRLPFVERMGLEDVVVTLYMDREMRLVVTGNHASSFGAISARWDEVHFPFVEVELHREAVDAPYTFATLDFSVRGKKARLTRALAPLPEGQTVTLRALATIGARIEYRVVAMGQELSAEPSDLDLL